MTGCPGLSRTFDGYGSKVSIDPQICVADSYCTKIKVCKFRVGRSFQPPNFKKSLKSVGNESEIYRT